MFFNSFSLVLEKFSFWQGDPALGYHSIKFRHFASFHLWWKENLIKHQKVSRYYENDCSFLALPFQTTANANFFSNWVFLLYDIRDYQDSRERRSLYLIPLYHIHPLHEHLHLSRAITAESSHLNMASGQTLTRNVWFPSG